VVSFQARFGSADDASSDPLAVLFDDAGHSQDEFREIIVGHSSLGRRLLVAFMERDWIISARKATRRERADDEEATGP